MKFFGDRMTQAVQASGTSAVVGLDPHLGRLPAGLRAGFEGKRGMAYFEAAAQAVVDFNRLVIDAVADLVPAEEIAERIGADTSLRRAAPRSTPARRHPRQGRERRDPRPPGPRPTAAG